MRALHLFAGGGGSTLAGMLMGWSSVGCVEIEPAFRRMLRARGERLVGSDVARFDGRRFHGAVDIVVGGSPCQDLSVAGKRAGLDGARSGLWFHQVRIFQETGARFLWWENVAGALTSNRGGDFAAVLASLDAAGCDAVWTCNRAAHVGAPHRRERVWLLAWRRDVAVTAGFGVEGRGPVSQPQPRVPSEQGLPGRDGAGGGAEDGCALRGVGGAPDGMAAGLDWPAARGLWPHGRGPAQAAWESPRTCSRQPRRGAKGVGDPAYAPFAQQRKQRLMALGNGWVPHQAVHAFGILWRLMQENAA
jgi:site-specific DNA-cytosine methylase